MSANSFDPSIDSLPQILAAALERRIELIDTRHENAFRLFSGFYEGYPDLVVDLYARTLVIFDYSENPLPSSSIVQIASSLYLKRLPWLRAVILKAHHAAQPEMRRGVVIHGTAPDRHITENGIRYGLDLLLNQDASFYLDTGNLRRWATENLGGKRVLNTFAYTGSLGVAARAGGARQVIHLDANRKFLNLAKASYALNGFPINKADFITGDFWEVTSRLRHSGELYDCVILDPPFFAASKRGRVDLLTESMQLINKVRSLVGHEGYLAVVNNALFLGGAEFMKTIEDVCSSGYLNLERIIPVPDDVAIPLQNRIQSPPADPAPFNHSTKIVILRVERKDRRKA